MLIIAFKCCVFAGKAASIADMCIMPDEFKRRLSDCAEYCPVSLANNELIDCSSYSRLTFAAEFRGNYVHFWSVYHSLFDYDFSSLTGLGDTLQSPEGLETAGVRAVC